MEICTAALDINTMTQAKVNRELEGLGADLTITDINKGYITCSMSKINSTVQDTEESNMLPPQGPTSNDNKEELAGAAVVLSLLYSPPYNSNSQHLDQSQMKCYYDHTHCLFLDYFSDPIPDDAVVYTAVIPFQYNKVEGRYTEFIGN